MPVIGRLDGQVDDVIISPVSRRRREGEPAADSDGRAGTRGQPPEDAPPANGQTPHPDESSAGADELPVWLL